MEAFQIITGEQGTIGTVGNAVLKRTFPHPAALIPHGFLLIWDQATFTETQFFGTQPYAEIFRPAVTAALPILIGIEILFVRRTVSAVAAALVVK